MKTTRPPGEPRRLRPVDIHVAQVRAMKIGPLFPRDESAGPLQGMRGVPRKATKAPFRHGRGHSVKRRLRELVTAACLSCTWTASGRTWRPVKRLLVAHAAKKHPAIAA